MNKLLKINHIAQYTGSLNMKLYLNTYILYFSSDLNI